LAPTFNSPSSYHLQEPASALSTKSPAKVFAAKYRGIMMRPMSTAVTKACEEYKLFVAHPDEIDHNMYGRFLGVLKGAMITSTWLGFPTGKASPFRFIDANLNYTPAMLCSHYDGQQIAHVTCIRYTMLEGRIVCTESGTFALFSIPR
jgi:hypothetical protein